MAATFKPIQYKSWRYPSNIIPEIEEIPSSFNRKEIKPTMRYSLHTEPAFGYEPAKMNRINSNLANYGELKKAFKKNTPLLWFNELWAEEFYRFINRLINNHKPPTIIEIHPPFKEYCRDIETFLLRYSIFEELILCEWPNTIIAIENRTTSKLRNNKFLISNNEDIEKLLRLSKRRENRLKLMLDIPQLIGRMGGFNNLNTQQMKDVFNSFESYKDIIIGIHIWGKNATGQGNHNANLLGLFENDSNRKEEFLTFLSAFFDDNIVRYLIPEVNFNKDNGFYRMIVDLEKFFNFLHNEDSLDDFS